jgi:Protein kinase domain
MAALPPRIGPYRIEERLGGGRTGEVFRAWDEVLRRTVALQRLHPALARDAALRERFRAAARAAAALDHPAIVCIHALHEDGGTDVLVMELAAGESLPARRTGPRGHGARVGGAGGELPAALRLAAQLASGLAAAHAGGMAHGDLRAGKVKVAPAGQIKILDFGFARRLFPAVSPGAPGETANAERADLAALGVLLRDLLDGAGGSPGGNLEPAISELIDGLLAAATAPHPPSAAEAAMVLSGATAMPSPPAVEEPAHSAPPVLAVPAAAAPPAIAMPDVDAPPTLAMPATDAQTALAMPATVVPTALAVPVTVAASGVAVPVTVAPTPPIPLSSGIAPHLATRALRVLRGRRGLAAALATAFLGAGGLLAWWLWPRAGPTLTVAVAPPVVTPGSGTGGSAPLAAALRVALADAAAALDGIVVAPKAAVDRAADRSPVAVARAVGAGEVVTSRLSCQPDTCEVWVSRISGRDGSVLWTQRWETPAGDTYALAAAAERYLRHAWAAHPQPGGAGAAALAVAPGDFQRYLGLRLALVPDGAPTAADLAAARSVCAGSPHFIPGALLLAELLRRRWAAGRDPAALAQSLAALAAARATAPADPRPLADEFALALQAQRWDLAGAADAALTRLRPQDPGAPVRRARLRAAVRRAPSAWIPSSLPFD